MGKYVLDLYPVKAQFLKNQAISMEMELCNNNDENIILDCDIKVMYLTEVKENIKIKFSLLRGENKIVNFSIPPQNCDFNGFGVDVYISAKGELCEVISSSFDVVSSYKKSTRYGFLSDFNSKEAGDLEDVQNLRKLHLNLIQFYDWMYRHDKLIPPEAEFTDLMGRKLSFNVVKEKVEACHKYGMKAIAYGAVYAASKQFYEKNKDLGLYYSNNEPINFINIFQIMNISEQCSWHWHIIQQYKDALEKGNFDGIHMDTYGFPKTAISKLNGINKVENLEYLFPSLINNTKEELQQIKDEVCIIFNNVGNWPVDTVAKCKQEAVYIEVWPPYERYHHIKEIITWAKYLSDNKPVILAAYLSPFKEENEKAEISALIITAVIFSNGAYHLIHGEKNGILTQGYYADYSTISNNFFNKMRKYYDFQIRYMNLLYNDELRDVSMTHLQGDNMEYIFENIEYSTYGEPNKVWVMVKENPKFKVINLVNLLGNEEDYWNKGKNTPKVIKDIFIDMAVEYDVKSVITASPDRESGCPLSADYDIINGIRGKRLKLKVSELKIWTMVAVEFYN